MSYCYGSFPAALLWLGAGAVEFIICHSEVSIVFVEERKIPEVHLIYKCLRVT